MPIHTQMPPTIESSSLHPLKHLVNDPQDQATQKCKPSYKCGCQSKLMVRRRADNGLMEVKWFWTHTGHDPFNMDNMLRWRMSDPLKTWIDKCVLLGLIWKAISKLLRSPDLFPVSWEDACIAFIGRIWKQSLGALSVVAQNTLGILTWLSGRPKFDPQDRNSYQAVPNSIRKTETHHTELDHTVFKSLSKWEMKLWGLGWLCDHNIMHTPNLRVISIFMSSWQKEQLPMYRGDVGCIDLIQNTTSNFPKVSLNKVSTFTL